MMYGTELLFNQLVINKVNFDYRVFNLLFRDKIKILFYNTKIKCLVNDKIQSVPVQNLTTKTRVLTRNGPKLVTKLTHHVQHNNKNDPNRMFRYKNLLLSGRHRTILDFKPDKKLNPRTYSCGYSVPCLSDPRFTEVVSDSDFDLYNFTLENTDINHRDIIEIEDVLVETTSEWYLSKLK